MLPLRRLKQSPWGPGRSHSAIGSWAHTKQGRTTPKGRWPPQRLEGRYAVPAHWAGWWLSDGQDDDLSVMPYICSNEPQDLLLSCLLFAHLSFKHIHALISSFLQVEVVHRELFCVR
mmetsp:Transcript_23510/g.69857  ORF Transcript_23510/g.69857 Transcript_23510/m.69857 type:complete len:117 (+) Transcript_23510:341-691(+)